MGDFLRALRGIGASSFFLLAGVQGHAGAPRPGVNFSVKLNFVIFDDSGWNSELLQAHFDEAQNVYEQCGVRLVLNKVYWAHAPSGSRDLLKSEQNYSSPLSIVRLAEATRNLPRPLVFLIHSTSLEDSFDSAFSRAAFPDHYPNYPDVLLDTIWLPLAVNSPKGSRMMRYSILAHEAAHVLLLDGNHNGDDPPNLMTVSMLRNNYLTSELCRTIVASRFTAPFLNSNDLVAKLEAN